MNTLFCLVHGEPTANAFSVDIDRGKTVGALKKLIKEEKQNDFNNVDADKLTLWALSPPIKEEDDDGLKALDLQNETGVRKLKRATAKISTELSGVPTDGYIHVVVERPSNTKDVRCKATHGRDTETFLWPVTRDTTTLVDLMKKLRSYFTFPDGTEDKDIDVSYVYGGLITRFIDDNELVAMIWRDGYCLDLTLVVATSQRPFSSWTFAKMKKVYNLTADCYSTLQTFEAGYADLKKYNKDVMHVFGDISVRLYLFIYLFI